MNITTKQAGLGLVALLLTLLVVATALLTGQHALGVLASIVPLPHSIVPLPHSVVPLPH